MSSSATMAACKEARHLTPLWFLIERERKATPPSQSPPPCPFPTAFAFTLRLRGRKILRSTLLFRRFEMVRCCRRPMAPQLDRSHVLPPPHQSPTPPLFSTSVLFARRSARYDDCAAFPPSTHRLVVARTGVYGRLNAAPPFFPHLCPPPSTPHGFQTETRRVTIPPSRAPLHGCGRAASSGRCHNTHNTRKKCKSAHTQP